MSECITPVPNSLWNLSSVMLYFKILLLNAAVWGSVKMFKMPLRVKASKNVFSEIRFKFTKLVWIL